MATVCDYCGHKTNEVKSGGGMEDKGKKIVLKVTDSSDLSRDVLKVASFFHFDKFPTCLYKRAVSFQSETCSLTIPELELEMGCHALSGRFTTLEGLLRNVFEQVREHIFLKKRNIYFSWFFPTAFLDSPKPNPRREAAHRRFCRR